MATTHHDRVSLYDAFTFAFVLAFNLPTTVISCLIRRLWTPSNYTVKYDIIMATIRCFGLVPISIRRRMMKRDHTATLRTSRRFSKADPGLCERVSRPGFVGHWICKGSINDAQTSPSQAHATLLWIHGGAYIVSGPFTNLVTLLRIAELAAEKNLSINIFALEYSLAPEAKFPTQINQATAAYRYLIEEEGLDPNSIMVLGESAGGHLALAQAYSLHQQGLPRPGKIGLLYPWVNLDNSGSTFATNKYKDCLNGVDLDEAVAGLLGEHGRERYAPYVNFAASPPPDDFHWSQILPPTWVAVGGNDLFFSDVCTFVEVARKDGVTVDLHVEDGQPHGWLSFQDLVAEKQYLQLAPEEDARSVLAGSETMAEVVCAHVEECKRQKTA